MPEPAMALMLAAIHASRSAGSGNDTTDNARDSRSSEPRRVIGSVPSWAVRSSMTCSVAVAVVASTGVPGASRARAVRIRR